MTPHRGMLVEFYASDVVHIVIDVRGDIYIYMHHRTQQLSRCVTIV